MKSLNPETSSPIDSTADWLDVVRHNVANLRFGSIQITVHEGRVTQVESIEKTRFVATRENSSAARK